ncbi:hypothetical protein [Flavobacterium sp.]|uniref:hypothetical protein n=1 Tax=Flavobacterium sp. TaxID=239 RepID=UPI0025F93F84|nr:hypothetical protein [Flavobacterium sp.]
MKFFSLCFFLFSLFISCSSSELTAEAPIDNHSFYRLVDLGYDLDARNAANPYDDVGQVHNELLLTYYYADSLPSTFNGIVTTLTSIANNNSSFTDLHKNVPYEFSNAAENRVLAIMTEQDSCLTAVIDSSVVGQVARDSLDDFVHDFLDLCDTEEDYSVIYDYVVAYEDAVLKLTWSAEDKRVVLITTTVARHSAYAKKKRPKKNKDPDWSYLVWNIIATIDGADEGEAEAVMRGLVAGVVEN